MSVTTEANRTSELTTDGVIEDFDFSMLIHNKTWLQVYYQPTGGSYTQLTLDTDYGVVFTEDGGTVSTAGYTAPLLAGKLLIIRRPPLTQTTNWLYNDNHSEQTHQDDFDHRSICDMWFLEQLDRCPKFPTYSGTKDITFPEPVANEIVGWNAGGTDLANISTSALAVLIAADIELGEVPENLTDLSDVTVTAPATGQILYYNGSLWLNTNAPTLTSITIGANTLNTTEWAYLDGLDQALKTTDAPDFASGVTVGTLTFADGSITDSGGTIDFGNENLITSTGQIKASRFGIRDSETADYYLTLWAENTGITADKHLTFNVGNTNRVLTLSGNPTLGDWFDQSVKTTATAIFDQIVIEDAAKTLIDVDASNDLLIENLTGARFIKLAAGGGVLVTGNIGVTAHTDLLQLASGALTVNGTILGTGTISSSAKIEVTTSVFRCKANDGLDKTGKAAIVILDGDGVTTHTLTFHGGILTVYAAT